MTPDDEKALDEARAEQRRLRDVIVSARWRLAKGRGLWNGPSIECDAVLEAGIVIGAGEPTDFERLTKRVTTLQDECDAAHRDLAASEARAFELAANQCHRPRMDE